MRYAGRMPAQLSGGQRQSVALTRCLVVEPSLLLDEPLGALDKSLRESMQVDLRALRQRLGITTIMVTHDQDEALTVADQVAISIEPAVAAEGSNRVLGTVEQVVYRGFVSHIYVRQDNGEMLIAFQSNRPGSEGGAPPAPGARVLARWNSASNRIVHDDEM